MLRNIEEKLAEEILDKYSGNNVIDEKKASILANYSGENYDDETLAYDIVGDAFEKIARSSMAGGASKARFKGFSKDERKAFEDRISYLRNAEDFSQLGRTRMERIKGALSGAPGKISGGAKSVRDAIKAHPYRSAGIGAGAAAATVGGTLAVRHILNKIKNNQPLTEEEAAVVADKTASEAYAVANYAINKMAASEEFYADGQADMQASLEVLAEYGFLDENGGLDKQAAEESYETIDFVNNALDTYNDGAEKMAAAEHCYNEGEIELTAAVQVLEDLGYSLD